MQIEHSPQDISQDVSQQASEQQSSEDDARLRQAWSDLARDVDQLGRQLGKLGTHTATLGAKVVDNLQARLAEVKTRAQTCQQLSEQRLKTLQRSAWLQTDEAQRLFGQARTRSKDAANQAWERSEPLRLGARDVGEGLGRAWTELRASLGKAAGRLQSESGNGASPAEEHRDATQ